MRHAAVSKPFHPPPPAMSGKKAARARERQAAAASQDEAEESDATEEEATRERTTRVGRPRTTARWHEGCSENRRETAKRDRKRRTPKGGRRLAHHTPLLKIPAWWRRAVLPSSLGVVRFLSFFMSATASTTLLPLKSLCGGGVPSSHPSLGLSAFFLSFLDMSDLSEF